VNISEGCLAEVPPGAQADCWKLRADHAGQARDEPGPFSAKGRFDRLVRLARSPTLAKVLGETSRLQPTVSGDAQLHARRVTGRRVLGLGRQNLGQIRHL
jgi:hypothetical protein